MKRLELTAEQQESYVKDYPFLKARNIFTDEIVEHNYLSEVPNGWLNIFIDFLPKLKKCLIKNNFLEQYRIIQIKEKYGMLRLYDNADIKELNDLVSELQQLSEKTCIICGDKAEWRSFGWISPYCNECKEHLEKKMQNDGMTKHFEPIVK